MSRAKIAARIAPTTANPAMTPPLRPESDDVEAVIPRAWSITYCSTHSPKVQLDKPRPLDPKSWLRNGDPNVHEPMSVPEQSIVRGPERVLIVSERLSPPFYARISKLHAYVGHCLPPHRRRKRLPTKDRYSSALSTSSPIHSCLHLQLSSLDCIRWPDRRTVPLRGTRAERRLGSSLQPTWRT